MHAWTQTDPQSGQKHYTSSHTARGAVTTTGKLLDDSKKSMFIQE